MNLASVIDKIRRRIRDVVDEAEYGRKRMLEVRTGHVYTEETRRRRAAHEIENLNALFTEDGVSWEPDGERDPVDAPDEDRRDDWPGFHGP